MKEVNKRRLDFLSLSEHEYGSWEFGSNKVKELAGFRWLFGKQGGCQALCLAGWLVDFVAG